MIKDSPTRTFPSAKDDLEAAKIGAMLVSQLSFGLADTDFLLQHELRRGID
jgi:hypothetical protein